jgi:hypothetical protein
MATRSNIIGRARRQELRHHLHEAVDRIFDGPGSGDEDRWVRQVLVDVGLIFGTAGPALDYEVGRIISGVDRPYGVFRPDGSWRGAEIIVSRKRASEWRSAGYAARADWPPSEIQQEALAALLRPIASISLHSWFLHLVNALDGLRFGDVRPPLRPSSRRLWGGTKAWQQRLDGLRCAEFQVGARMLTKNAANETVAKEIGVPISTFKGWRREVANKFGPAVVREELDTARRLGRLVHQTRTQVTKGEANERDRSYCIHLEAVYRERLKKVGEGFKAQTRKKHKG